MDDGMRWPVAALSVVLVARWARRRGDRRAPAPAASGTRRRTPPPGAARSAVVDKRTGCEKPAILANPPRIAPPPFPLVDANRPNPICRLAQRRTIDVPLGGGAPAAASTRGRRCGNYNPATKCFPSAFRNGNARVLRQSFAPPSSGPIR